MNTQHPARILLVDDEEQVVKVIERMLTKVGHELRTTRSPSQALTWVQDPDIEIDLLLTDIVMPPEMSGLELARRVRQERPDLPVLFVSAYDDYDDEIPAAAHLLRKPFSMRELVQTIEDLLQDSRGTDQGSTP